jgi:hypothetical protein
MPATILAKLHDDIDRGVEKVVRERGVKDVVVREQADVIAQPMNSCRSGRSS